MSRTLYLVMSFVLFLSSTQISILAQELPHHMTEAEKRAMPAYLEAVKNNSNRDGITSAPVSPVRTMAEWEEVQAICITWTSYTEILREIVRHAKEEADVYIVCSNEASVVSYLEAGDVEVTDNIYFFEEPFNSIWIRDYGPWTVYTNDVDSLKIVDWIYNRPRPADDVIPEVFADHLGIAMHETTTAPNDMVHTGGNHMVDGLGTAFSSKLIHQENPDKTDAEIDEIMSEFMGVDRYIKMEMLPYDGIHHIDMHMKLLDEETLVMGEYPEGVADGPQIEENLDYVRSNFLSPFGNPYKVVRMPMPPDAGDDYPDSGGDYRTFTNSVFINKLLLVPIYEEQYDTVALNIYRKELPGYKVVGIDCNDIIPASGALHCITKLIGTDDPLLIAHPRVRDQYVESEVQIEAIIQHRSGISTANLHYRLDTLSDYITVAMSENDDMGENHWTANIPEFPYGTEVYYYIDAEANSGKTQVRPLTAPDYGYSYKVLEVTEEPTVDVIMPTTSLCEGGTIGFLDFSTEGVTEWFWTFEGGTPAFSTEQYPSVTYAEAGTYDVSLSVTNAIGSNDQTFEQVITVSGGQVPSDSNFEDGIDDTWSINNSSGDDVTWEWIEDDSCDGGVVYINNYNNSNEGAKDLLEATFDLSAYEENAVLHFDYAYTYYSGGFGGDYVDQLEVLAISCDGEVNTLFSEIGENLATVSPLNSEYTPDDCGDWESVSLNLSPYAGGLVTVHFVNTSGYGNNLFIDNISVDGFAVGIDETVPAQEQLIELYPNPTQNQLYWKQSGAVQLSYLQLFSPQGQLVFQTNTQGSNHLSLPDLAAGVYIAKLHTSAGIQEQKLTILR